MDSSIDKATGPGGVMFIVKVRVGLLDGETAMVGNDLRFDTHADALAYINDLASRWTLVKEWTIEAEYVDN